MEDVRTICSNNCHLWYWIFFNLKFKVFKALLAGVLSRFSWEQISQPPAVYPFINQSEHSRVEGQTYEHEPVSCFYSAPYSYAIGKVWRGMLSCVKKWENVGIVQVSMPPWYFLRKTGWTLELLALLMQSWLLHIRNVIALVVASETVYSQKHPLRTSETFLS